MKHVVLSFASPAVSGPGPKSVTGAKTICVRMLASSGRNECVVF